MSTQRKPDQSKNLFFPDFANQQICKQSLAVYIIQYMWTKPCYFGPAVHKQWNIYQNQVMTA